MSRPSGDSSSSHLNTKTARDPACENTGNEQYWSIRMAESIMRRKPEPEARWEYEWGVVLRAFEQVWLKTGDQRYFDYVKANMDECVDSNGNIKNYQIEDYNLDMINMGRMLYPLYRQTGDKRYRDAAVLLRRQLSLQPRTSEGGFWHKQIYPHQMWLDGIYMAGPFYAEYAKVFDEPEAFDDVAHQVVLVESHTRDPQSGLLYHAWDESKGQKWADPETGCSPHYWGRAIGWYCMAIVDILDYLPEDHQERDTIITILKDTVKALVAVQEPASGLWYQVLDQGDRDGNYLEASASCMYIYAIAKGIRRGYIDDSLLEVATKAYKGVLKHLIDADSDGLVNLNQVCSVAGLGGDPYRDGSYEYYISEKIVSNDDKGVGPFILASIEIEECV